MREIILTDIERTIVETEGAIKYLKEQIKTLNKECTKYNAHLEMYKDNMVTNLYSDLKIEATHDIEKYTNAIKYLEESLEVRYIQYEIEQKVMQHNQLQEQNPFPGSRSCDL